MRAVQARQKDRVEDDEEKKQRYGNQSVVHEKTASMQQ